MDVDLFETWKDTAFGGSCSAAVGVVAVVEAVAAAVVVHAAVDAVVGAVNVVGDVVVAAVDAAEAEAEADAAAAAAAAVVAVVDVAAEDVVVDTGSVVAAVGFFVNVGFGVAGSVAGIVETDSDFDAFAAHNAADVEQVDAVAALDGDGVAFHSLLDSDLGCYDEDEASQRSHPSIAFDS